MALTKVSYSMIDAAPINVADFGATGDGVTNDTAAIQAAFDAVSASGGTVVFEPSKTYMIDGQYLPLQTLFGGVKPKSNTLIQGNNSTLKVIPNNFIGYCVLNIANCDGITIYNLNILGDVSTHTGSTGEFGHGIIIANSTNVRLYNVSSNDCWGDGLLSSNYSVGFATGNVEAYSCLFNNNRRQGMSIVNMTNGVFVGCSFNNTGRTLATSPASGVDLEPDFAGAVASNISFISCNFYNNQSHGLIGGSSGNVVENIKLVSCYFESNGAAAITAFSAGATPNVQGLFEIIDCEITGQVRVDNCKIIGGQINLDDNYLNTFWAVESVADLPFQMIGTSVFVTDTRKAALIVGATSESSRKLVQNCKFNQDNNTLTNLDTWVSMGGFITLDNCQMTRTGAAPATGYTFSGAADFTGFNAKMVNCYLDSKLASGFSQDGLMVRVAQRGWVSAAPTTGAHTVGEIVLNSAPASAGYIGWVCTVAGTPGTWQTFGLIS